MKPRALIHALWLMALLVSTAVWGAGSIGILQGDHFKSDFKESTAPVDSKILAGIKASLNKASGSSISSFQTNGKTIDIDVPGNEIAIVEKGQNGENRVEVSYPLSALAPNFKRPSCQDGPAENNVEFLGIHPKSRTRLTGEKRDCVSIELDPNSMRDLTEDLGPEELGIAETSNIAARAAHSDPAIVRMIDNAKRTLERTAANSDDDNFLLRNEFRDLPEAEKNGAFERSWNNLRKQVAELEAYVKRGQKHGQSYDADTLLTAYKRALEKAQSLATQKNRNAGASALFRTSPNDPEALADRLVTFYALSDASQKRVAGKLKLAGKVYPNSNLFLLHNGYVLGGRGQKGAIDCSYFVSSALGAKNGPNGKGVGFTTWNFRKIWENRCSGKPQSDLSCQEKALAKAFTAIDIYSGDTLMPGDLLFYNNKNGGHIVIVTDYEAISGKASFIESNSNGRAPIQRDQKMQLSDGSIRPGLMALRLKDPSKGISLTECGN